MHIRNGKGGRFGRVFLPAFSLAAIMLLIVGFLTSHPDSRADRQEPGLVVVSAADPARKLVFSLEERGRFTIEYTHSVDRVPVREYYRIDESGRLVLEMFENETFGAGLGDQMGKLVRINGRQFVKDILLELERLPLRVGGIADQVIKAPFFPGGQQNAGVQKSRLLDTFDAGELVYIHFVRSECSNHGERQ